MATSPSARPPQPGLLATWRLAVHSGMLSGHSTAEAISIAASHGYQGIFAQLDANTADRTADDLAGSGNNSVVITAVGFAPEDQNPLPPARAADIAQRLGAAHLRICGASMTGQSYASAYDATLRLCEAYSAPARHHGIRLLLHQRWGTVTTSASQLARIVSHFDPHDVGCIYDAGSMTIEGYEEYRIGLEILGSYVADVHIANTRHFPSAQRTVWEWEWSGLSDGLLDIQRLFRALRRAGYGGWVTVADRSEGRPGAALLQADLQMLEQAMADVEGVGSHNPSRPLDDHVDLAERPERNAHAHVLLDRGRR